MIKLAIQSEKDKTQTTAPPQQTNLLGGHCRGDYDIIAISSIYGILLCTPTCCTQTLQNGYHL